MFSLFHMMLSLVYAIHHIDLTTTSFCAADKFRADLMNIAMTTLSSKILSQDKEYFAELAVDAVLRLKVFELSLDF
jgi:chaperonin GroEL (HSP60 family)